eukprot:CAMPEP_0206516420 /NCGR_PEP_ID=MMETSP0324_2-20121206/63365_1 /ASSEMBLY_ACC=CAM_ASM_000836 /TAXON_ID=2866 /ORGANISM="Crypthecodinium cohnii, Strain Seligo" /LENGTH=111 /DNA_ID=CAMNT_0054009367 /DNA_START=196 /DNA_END=531 /DNA_ORIENTATION=+
MKLFMQTFNTLFKLIDIPTLEAPGHSPSVGRRELVWLHGGRAFLNVVVVASFFKLLEVDTVDGPVVELVSQSVLLGRDGRHFICQEAVILVGGAADVDVNSALQCSLEIFL